MFEFKDELFHHGVKGQKWGVRRYQNEDGSYTSKGRKRYGMDLDLNDKSRKNIAKIRTGEAKRRLDVAKANNDTNYTRIAELQGRVRSAKRNERRVRSIDKGSKLAAKGQTITGNKIKSAVVYSGSQIAAKNLAEYMQKRVDQLQTEGRLTAGHLAVARATAIIGSSTISSLGIAYALKKTSDNRKIRAYYENDSSIKRIGSQEYADVIKRSKNK